MKNTRKSLFASLVTLLLCSAMFVGSTFAWFTDTVSNTGNKIQAGTLDVELWQKKTTLSEAQKADTTVKAITEEGYTEYSNISESTVAVFNYDKWEPGYATSLPFAVVNVGNLAFKYNVYFYITEETAGTHETSTADSLLSKVIKVYNGTSREDTKVEANYLGTLEDFTKEGTTGHKLSGKLLPKGSTPKETDEKVYIASSNLVFIMPEEAGNQYQGASLTFDIRVEATQYTYEEDGFGLNLYDDNSTLEPDSVQPSYATSKVENDKPTTFVVRDDNVAKEVGKNTTIEFEAGALTKEDEKPGESEIEIIATPILAANANSSFDIEVGNSSVGAIDLTVKVDGEEVHDFNGMTAKVITYIAKGLTLNGTDDIGVIYKGEKDQPTDITYDPETGLLSFRTNHFSQFLIDADQIAYIEENNTAYDTLYDAIDAVDENNKTIFLLQDINTKQNENYVINKDKNVILDVNGHTLKATAVDNKSAYTIKNEGTLVVKDSTDILCDGSGKGKIEMIALDPDLHGVPGFASNVITNHGTLYIESGVYHNESCPGGASFAIDNTNDATLNVMGGKISAKSSAAVRQWAIGSTNNNVTITGGNFVSTGAHGFWLQDGEVNSAGALTITGGYFEGKQNGIQIGHEGKSKKYNISISNCVVKGNLVFVYTDYTQMDVDESVTIIGGVLAKGVTSPYIAKNDATGKTGYLPDGSLGVDYEYDFGSSLEDYDIVMAYDCWSVPNPETTIDPSLYHIEGSKLIISGEAMKESAENYFSIWITSPVE